MVLVAVGILVYHYYLGGLESKNLGDLGDLTGFPVAFWLFVLCRKLPPRWLSSRFGIRLGVPIAGLLVRRDNSFNDKFAKA